MCHDPHSLPDGTIVACRNCELCRYNRVKDWAGRNVAQAKVSAASFACTLTYGPELDENRMPIPGKSDHIRMAVLTYSDVQKFLKYLRWLGYPCDYFITGELGGLKSRTHWHVILHFRDRVPTHELGVNFSDRHRNQYGKLYDHEVCKAWPHGFMFWKKAVFEDVFYNCKYILKDEADEAAQRKPGMSKKPPIGAEYFVRMADRYVDQHLAPQDLKYRHKEIRKKDGSPLDFMLKGRTAEIFLGRFIARWREVHGDKPRPRSQLVDLFEEYGKVVTDEARLLLRRQFPKGESRAVIPPAAKIKAMADEAKAELDERRREIALMERDAWGERWTKDAGNGPERQRRQENLDAERAERAEEHESAYAAFCAYKAEHGWRWVAGKGWVCDRAGPGVRGGEKFHVWIQARGAAEPRPRPEREREPRGKVGRWNWAYGPGEPRSDEGADAGPAAQAGRECAHDQRAKNPEGHPQGPAVGGAGEEIDP